MLVTYNNGSFDLHISAGFKANRGYMWVLKYLQQMYANAPILYTCINNSKIRKQTA